MELSCTFFRGRARQGLAVALALAAIAALAGPAGAGARSAPSPGAAGIGDRLFPTLGNGGYDARHYRLALTYPTDAPQQDVNGHVVMRARATQSLSRFNLDFDDGTVSAVEVNGRPADFDLSGGELVIDPHRALPDGKRFTTSVDFVADPDVPTDTLPFGWFTTADGSVTAGQPDQGHKIYPVNDHPADKATYTIRTNVPEGTTAVANGVLRSHRTANGRSISVYEMDQPMASELTQVAVGDLKVIDRGSTDGVEVRDVVANACADASEARLAKTPDHLQWMTDRVGRYPFANYGVLAADQLFGYALETQTLSLHPCFVFNPAQYPEPFAQTIMVHELAHQWFGDSVAPEEWSDVWLNEGHATWYEWNYGAEFFPQQDGFDFVPRVKAAYEQGNIWRSQYGPVAKPTSNDLFSLFSPNVYDGGAVVLYALRQEIGESAFAELERRWVQRNAGTSRSTDDFIALASRVAGQDLSSFLGDWLYGTEEPAMPGHPDWQPAPVTAAAARRSQSAARSVERSEALRLR